MCKFECAYLPFCFWASVSVCIWACLLECVFELLVCSCVYLCELESACVCLGSLCKCVCVCMHVCVFELLGVRVTRHEQNINLH